MALTQADFDGPYTEPKTGLQYEGFGAWFAGEQPLDNEHNNILFYEQAKQRLGAYIRVHNLDAKHRIVVGPDT